MRGFGYSDVKTQKPVDPNVTLFRPGSVSKLFTWTAVMQLVQSGKLNLDADVNTYLDFKIPPRDGKPITLRSLMTHTPGFAETAKYLIAFTRRGPCPPIRIMARRSRAISWSGFRASLSMNMSSGTSSRLRA